MKGVFAGAPLWTFEPLTATTISVPANGTATIQYRVTNQTSKPRTLTMQPIQGISQITTGLNVCGSAFFLRSKGSCILSLQVNGSALNTPIINGPVVCQQGSNNQCYRPGKVNILSVTQAPAITDAPITASGSPLTLTVNSSTGQLTINNTSTQLSATNIMSNFIGTALNGNVTETGNTCANVPPGGSCTLTFTPGNTVVPQTNFTIQGTNTNALTAAIAIQSGVTLTNINPSSGTASGGTGFTLTGTGLTAPISVTFGGVAATSVNLVNPTTVTGVTPANAAGAVDVVITTTVGGATLTNGYTYVTTAVGQSSRGGVIACLEGGNNNLIAASTDLSVGIEWGGLNTSVGLGARSTTDGATNTINIVNCLTNRFGCAANTPATPINISTYAAGICSTYEVDSQGNSPCQMGNACYSGWFLPATDQLRCLDDNKGDIGNFNIINGDYWASSESTTVPFIRALTLQFFNGTQSSAQKDDPSKSVRCVRSFVP